MCGILMNVKCLIIIGFILAVLTIGSVNASKDVDMLSNESVSIEDVEIDENSDATGRQRHTLGSLPTITAIFGLTIANNLILEISACKKKFS